MFHEMTAMQSCRRSPHIYPILPLPDRVIHRLAYFKIVNAELHLWINVPGVLTNPFKILSNPRFPVH